jgi:hypothetical protein
MFSTHDQLHDYDDVLLAAINIEALTNPVMIARICGPVAGHCTTFPVTAT